MAPIKYFFTRRQFFIHAKSMEFSCRISQNKFFEFNLYRLEDCETWFNILFGWPFKVDHSGPCLILRILWGEMEIKFYDHRHWDNFIGTWEPCVKGSCELFSDPDMDCDKRDQGYEN